MVEINKSTARLYSRLGQSGALFGIGLVEKSTEINNLAVLTADYEKPAGLSKFAKQYPNQFFNVGIAEQNLVGLAAGMVNEGIKTIASCQACFLSMRCFEQVRQYAGYMELPIIFVGVSSGFALTYFGNTHYALEDITLMRSIPGMNILSPSDPGQAAKAIESAIELSKPVYIRCTGIQGTKPIYSNDFDFRIGKLNILNPGKDLVVFSSGAITRNALDAVIQIKEEIGLDVKLIDVHTISPLDINTLKECMSAKLWISIEEHFTSGGLGSVLMEFLITQDGKRKPSLNRIGVNNKFTVPGDYDFLLRSHGLDKKGIYLKLLEATKKLY